jgi:hypothetical protein
MPILLGFAWGVILRDRLDTLNVERDCPLVVPTRDAPAHPQR